MAENKARISESSLKRKQSKRGEIERNRTRTRTKEKCERNKEKKWRASGKKMSGRILKNWNKNKKK